MKYFTFLVASLCTTAHATEYHVSNHWKNASDGVLTTISAAAELAQPGDVITVHEGTYRERIDPPRSGTSDRKRIVYRAAPGEEVFIKGSEKITGWKKVINDTWEVTLPNTFFGDFNPFATVLKGDWLHNPFNLHMGAVYLNGHWLTETRAKDEVLAPYGKVPQWMYHNRDGYLMNVAWFQPGSPEENLPRKRAVDFSGRENLKPTENKDEGEVIGYIRTGSCATYTDIDFSENTTNLIFRIDTGGRGGRIEIRLDDPESKVAGILEVVNPGNHWGTYKTLAAQIKPVSGRHDLYLTFKSLNTSQIKVNGLWHAEVDGSNTTIRAQFKEIDPNKADVEISVRKTVFYPSKPGMNYITVRGFKMTQAATPWAPPTAEQIGMIGTHWSKGWIIEDNEISYSLCTGITLGKYGDEWDNRAGSAEGYVGTIKRALSNGWNKATVGSHLVRNNHIHHCEQAGIVGSMGVAYSEITGNTIHEIHVRRYFEGAETAGIKFHGAVDTLIAGNHIYRANRGIWLDWMTQGTRISRNLLHDNGVEDLFIEVNHGPFLVDNNIMLSDISVIDWSQGAAFIHNLMAGEIRWQQEPYGRETPHLKPHGTDIVALEKIKGGDCRFYNNIFINDGLAKYDQAGLPIYAAGNVCLNSTALSRQEGGALALPAFDPKLNCEIIESGTILEITLPEELVKYRPELITGEVLSKPHFVDQNYTDFDGSELKIDQDFFEKRRKKSKLKAGPFATLKAGKQTINLREGIHQ